METVLTKTSPSTKKELIKKPNYLYFGNDPIFKLKLKLFLEKNYNIKTFNRSKEILFFLKTNRNSKNLILSEFNVENEEGGLQLHKTIKRDFPAVSFFLLSDEKTARNKILLAKNKGVKDVLLKDRPVNRLLTRINFHLETRKKNPESQKFLVKSEVSFTKRAFDITLTSIALLLLSPLLILVTLLIKLDSPGPIFYISKRVGTNGRVFDFYKFRSMKKDASSNIDNMKNMNQYDEKEEESILECEKCKTLSEPCSPILIVDGDEICESLYLKQKESSKISFLKFKNDPRITRLGRLLRKSSIDELPQLLNILKGDMSIVGNRPLPVYEAEQLTDDECSVRFLAPAGLTGLWQISKRGKSKMSEAERKELDKTYAMNHSFLGDLKIILMTIPALFQSENV